MYSFLSYLTLDRTLAVSMSLCASFSIAHILDFWDRIDKIKELEMEEYYE